MRASFGTDSGKPGAFSALLPKSRPIRESQRTAGICGATCNTLRKEERPAYWNALDVLAGLYLEGKQPEQARQKLDEMQELLAKAPDSARTARVEELRKLIAALENANAVR